MKITGWLGKAGVVGLGVVCVAGFSPASRAEDTKAPAAKQEAAKPKPVAGKPTPAKQVSLDSAEGPVTITNEDLERMFGPPDVKPPESDTAPEGKTPGEAKATKEGDPTNDPLKWMEAEKKNAADRQAKIDTAQKKLADAEASLKNLEARLLATKNPYLARPVMTDAEAKQVEGLDNSQRVDLNAKEIQDARAQVEKSRAELTQAQAAR